MKKYSIIAIPLAIITALATVPVSAQTQNSIVINEVESNGDAVGDWVEIANTDTTNSLDISGWSIVDNNQKHAPLVFPTGTIIESGGYFSIYTEPADGSGFGLGGNDSVTLFDASGSQVDHTEWTEHAATTWGRIPDMTGEFAVTGQATRNLRNIAAGAPEPLHNATLPYHDTEIHNLDLGAEFVIEDFSGIDFDSDGRAWIVNNDAGDIYALDFDSASNTYTSAGHWQTTYPAGIGTPDGEGISVGADGALYLATERNNSDKGTSRPSILRFERPAEPAGTLIATNEWNLSEFTGTIGANAGLETIEHLEDSIFAVGVEGTGQVIVVDIADSAPVQKQTYQSPFTGVMALDYVANTKELQVFCDEVCDGISLFLSWDGTNLSSTGDNIYARPAGMDNFANEGFASYRTTTECVTGTQTTNTRYLWADDSVTNGTSLRAAFTAESTECESEPTGSSESGFAKVIATIFGFLGNLINHILRFLSGSTA